MQEIILGGGCFWCIDAIFRQVKGVLEVDSGYSGGTTVNPTYESVCAHIGNHAEVVKINFDEKIITLPEILDIFFHLHDPTTLNRQGADVGTQYRSIVFYHDEIQKNTILEAIGEAQNDWPDPIVTEVVQEQPFYKAEDYHQDYFNKNPYQGYCNAIISPKLSKLAKLYFKNLK